MENPDLNNMSDNLQLYFILLQPFIHGNPGNATVMANLMKINPAIDSMDLDLAEKKFRMKHPEHKDEPGWLWIIYKDLCKKDIQKTNEYLKQMVI